jgi:hypothetical protein
LFRVVGFWFCFVWLLVTRLFGVRVARGDLLLNIDFDLTDLSLDVDFDLSSHTRLFVC